MKDERALYLNWSDVVKLFLAGLGGMLFFMAAFVRYGGSQDRFVSCLLGFPFLLLFLIAVLTAVEKWMRSRLAARSLCRTQPRTGAAKTTIMRTGKREVTSWRR